MTARPLDLDAFREPARAFGILPFWFLNGELDPDEMRFQLHELRDKGMQGVILHGRFGLEMPYVGDRYLDRIKLAVDEAHDLGLTAWIYDEMNWPSGTADKRVLRARPDLAQRYLECISFTIQGPWFMCLTGEDSRYLDFERSTPVAAFATGENGDVLDLTANLSFGNVVPWEVPPGTWRLSYLVEKRADYYIDALDPESTSEFIRQGYEPYARTIGEGFSDKIVGFYSDEPAMHYFLSAQDNAVVPWTINMFRRFSERNGYDLRPRLPDLFFEVRDDSARVRHDFYTTLTAFYSDAYYGQLQAWCRAHGVVFVAHLLYEEWLRRMVRVEGNLFSHYRRMDVVGVDHLYPVIGTRSAPDQHVAMKVASSAAHHFDSERVICESFGGIFMDATMQRMKWIADWEFVLGINVLNPHGFHYTLEGPRKRDWPPSMFYQYPWWRHYGCFADYMSRLSEMLTGGRHVAKVAVVWPINAMFAEYLPQERTEASDIIEAGLNAVTDRLLRLHHDFDYLDEDVLAGADIGQGRIRVGDEAYELVVVPPMTHLRLATVEALERFVASDGKVLGVLTAPSRGLGDRGLVDIADRINTLFSGRSGRFVSGDAKALIDDANAGGDQLADLLREAVGSLIEPDVILDNDELFVLHRVKDERDVYFVVNPTFEPQRARMSLTGEAAPTLWDPTNGDEVPAGPVEIGDGRTTFELTMPPVGSTFVVVTDVVEPRIVGTNVLIDRVAHGTARGYARSDEGWIDVRRNGHVARTSLAAGPLPDPLVLDGPWAFEVEGSNALVLTSFRASPDADGTSDPSSWADPGTADDDWLVVGPGAWSYQIAAEPDRPYPIAVRYRIPFEVAERPDRLELVIDGFDGSGYDLFLNGHPVTATPVRSSVDSQMLSVDLTHLVVEGRNVLGVRLVVERATGGIVDNVKLTGAFSLGDGDTLRSPITEVQPAPWTEQGYPFLSGTGVYRRSFDLPDSFSDTRMFLEVPVRDDVLEVHLNGAPAGVRLWDPYVVDVTGLVRPGPNELSISVTNTLANLLNGVARASGLNGAPTMVPHASFEFDLTSAGEASDG